MGKETMIYAIILVNCDCASYVMAKPSYVFGKYKIGPKCKGCNSTLGPMQWIIGPNINARNEQEAIDIYKKTTRIKHENPNKKQRRKNSRRNR